ncbi:hypothetical protein ACOMHN_051652 [Nucella lapillus]
MLCRPAEDKQGHPTHRLQVNDSSIVSHRHSFHTCNPIFTEVSQEGSSLTTENLIGAWFNEASPFGSVSVRGVPFDIYIQPLNPMENPELNKSIVKLFYQKAGSGSQQPLAGHKLSEMGKLVNTKVCAEGERLSVSCDMPQGVQLPLVCVITVPLKFDVDIEGSAGASVVVRGMESDRVRVHLKQGDCHLTNLKTGNVSVECDDGSITSSKQLLGTISLRCCSNGSIQADRLQGLSLSCVTEGGDIDVKTVYAEKSRCQSQSGSVHIRDCHGDMTVDTVGGNLTVDSLDGKLSADLAEGSADVYVTRQDEVRVHSHKGDVTVRFSEDGSCSLDLEATVIEQDESLTFELNDQGKGFLNSPTEHTVRALAPQGKISLKKQDWLSAIKLQFGNTTP